MKLRSLKRRVLYLYFLLVLLFILFLHMAQFSLWLLPVRLLSEVDRSSASVPVVYDPRYNISFFGLEAFHRFDSKKYGRTFEALKQKGVIDEHNTFRAGIPSNEALRLVHAQDYLTSLRESKTIARVTELGFIRFFPSYISQQVILVPMLYQTGGSLMASDLAIEKGWAINLGGGFHHASADNGEGFCALADVSLMIAHVKKKYPSIKKVMIIDLDAHQGNGHERDHKGAEDVFIYDIYNADIYPGDQEAKKAIDFGVELPAYTADSVYLNDLETTLPRVMNSFNPDMIIYIAGSDILEGDPLGALSVSEDGLIKRDEIVFNLALSRKTPIVMLFGGGYQKENARVIARSIENLNNKFGIITAAKEGKEKRLSE